MHPLEINFEDLTLLVNLEIETISGDWDNHFLNRNPTIKEGLDFNYDWITGKLDNGYKVFDIGMGGYNNYSPNYRMETDMIYIRNYPTIKTNFSSYLTGRSRFALWNN